MVLNFLFFNQFYEVLDVYSPRSSIRIRLKGKGVKPVVSSSIQDGVLDFGWALLRDFVPMSFKVKKTVHGMVTLL